MIIGADRSRRSLLVITAFAMFAVACAGDGGPARLVGAGATGSPPPPTPPHLVFTQQPTTATVGRVMDPVVVAVLDSLGNLVTAATDTITVSIYAAPGSARLTGTLRVLAVGGAATFSDLSLDVPGGGYVLAAAGSDSSISGAVSGPLGIAWRALAITGSCALTDAGAAYCWGRNDGGQLGNGSVNAGLGTFPPGPVLGGLTFASLSQGVAHRCGITRGGETWCWGNNSSGALGDGGFGVRPTPVRVSGGLAFTSVTAGDEHTCGLVASGTAYCWGFNRYGELGDGTDSLRSVPVPVAGGLHFSAIKAARFNTCGITLDGSAWCWGNNDGGQLVTGDTLPRNAPVPIPLAGPFTSLALGWSYACGLTSNQVYCWGFIPLVANVGDGGLELLVPTVMPMRDVPRSLGAAETTACASNAKNKLFCWGFVGEGAMPNNSSIVVDHPVSVGTPVPLVTWVAGGYPCGISSDGTAWCYAYDPTGVPSPGDTVTYAPKRVPLY